MVPLKLNKVSMVVNMTDLLICRCKKKEMELEELKQQLKTEKIRKKRATESSSHHHCENEDPWLKDLQGRLDEAKRRSANVELQVCLQLTEMLKLLTYDMRAKAIKITFCFSGKSHSEIYVKSTPCRPGEDCRAGATGVTATQLYVFWDLVLCN